MLEQLIREKAYQIWEAEGFPEGRAEAHWELARHALAEKRHALAEKPVQGKSSEKTRAPAKPRTKKTKPAAR